VIRTADGDPTAQVGFAIKVFETIPQLLDSEELKGEGSDANQQYVLWNQAGGTQMIINASPIFPGCKVLT